jgi:hypothetical protein
MSPIRSVGLRFALTERIYHSRNHAQAAARSALEAGVLERRGMSELHLRSRSWSREERDVLWSHVTISVISAAASLEAAINELYGDAADVATDHPHHKASLYASLDRSVAEDLAFVWEIADRQAEPLQRYQLALTTGHLAHLDPGRQPFQECALIVKLRNYVTHSRPDLIRRSQRIAPQRRPPRPTEPTPSVASGPAQACR